MKRPRLELEQRGERAIQTTYAILVCSGRDRHEITQARSGSFDCTPYEPKRLFWRFVAELHRIGDQRVLSVTETDEEHVVEGSDWVTHRHDQRHLFRCAIDSQEWIRVEDVAPLSAELSEETLLDRVESGS